MNLDTYQTAAFAFANPELTPQQGLAVWALGLGGEAGEVQEHVKKYLGHGHPLDEDQIAMELGDVLWYVAAMASHMGLSLDDIAKANLCKLTDRYGDGFTAEKSLGRAS